MVAVLARDGSIGAFEEWVPERRCLTPPPDSASFSLLCHPARLRPAVARSSDRRESPTIRARYGLVEGRWHEIDRNSRPQCTCLGDARASGTRNSRAVARSARPRHVFLARHLLLRVSSPMQRDVFFEGTLGARRRSFTAMAAPDRAPRYTNSARIAEPRLAGFQLTIEPALRKDSRLDAYRPPVWIQSIYKRGPYSAKRLHTGTPTGLPRRPSVQHQPHQPAAVDSPPSNRPYVESFRTQSGRPRIDARPPLSPRLRRSIDQALRVSDKDK